MNGINKIFIAGSLTVKPVLAKSENGKSFTQLELEMSRFSYNGKGGWFKKTIEHSVLVWGKKAEVCEKVLEVGSPLIVEGFLEKSKENKPLIVAEDVHFLGLRTMSTTDSKEAKNSQ